MDEVNTRKTHEWIPHVIYVEGKTSTEQSRSIMDAEKGLCCRHNLDDNGWWDDYHGEEVIILDDFRDWHMKMSELLGILTGESTLKQRGKAPVQNMAKRIYITNTRPFADLYKGVKNEYRGQLERRVLNRWNTNDDDILAQCLALKKEECRPRVPMDRTGRENAVLKPKFVYDPTHDYDNNNSHMGDYNAFAS